MTAAVSGLGAIASVGKDVPELFDSLCAGHSGLASMRAFEHERYNARQLFEVDNRTEGRDMPERASALLETAISEALADAGIDGDLSCVPVLIGTGLRELRSVELWWRDGAEFDAGRLHFGTALRHGFSAADTHTFAGACSASLYALALGSDLLAAGEAETVVVAGVDVVTESMFGLSDRFQPVPPDAVRPLDVHRRGTILGEGAGAVVLRADPGARARARLRSVGVNCDAYHATAPDPAGVSSSIRQAHERSGIKPRDVDLIMLHGTGTPLNDEVEAGAVREIFGDVLDRPLLTGIKSMTGHTSGSAGVLSLITAVRCLETGLVPPITGITEPIQETDGMRVARDSAVRADPSVAQVHGFGFGGVNAVAMLEAV